MTTQQEWMTELPLTLSAATAAELMTSNPLSIGQNASVKEAASFFTDRGISAAPVIDDAGRAVGVLSRTDIVMHHRQQAQYVPGVSDYYERPELSARADERVPEGFQVENVDRTQVNEIMTPTVYAVSVNDPPRKVVSLMVEEKVHRVFVVDANGVLVGVISALDLLRRLQ